MNPCVAACPATLENVPRRFNPLGELPAGQHSASFQEVLRALAEMAALDAEVEERKVSLATAIPNALEASARGGRNPGVLFPTKKFREGVCAVAPRTVKCAMGPFGEGEGLRQGAPAPDTTDSTPMSKSTAIALARQT